MATIKSFSDLSQSKKLAEILPLESADMYYEEVCNLPKVIVGNYILHNQCMEDKDYKKLSNPVLSPAWSLAALLGVLPKIHGLKPILDLEECSIQYSGIDLYIVASNPIDACYETILKLHELKML